MKLLKAGLLMLLVLLVFSCNQSDQNHNQHDAADMIIRLSEIEIDPDFLEEYLSILSEESEASVRLEPGVISIYPMVQKEKPTEIRILEIYADRKAYEAHLQTPHFKKYKSTTLNMVKNLNLIDMEAVNGKAMPEIFKKLNP